MEATLWTPRPRRIGSHSLDFFQPSHPRGLKIVLAVDGSTGRRIEDTRFDRDPRERGSQPPLMLVTAMASIDGFSMSTFSPGTAASHWRLIVSAAAGVDRVPCTAAVTLGPEGA